MPEEIIDKFKLQMMIHQIHHKCKKEILLKVSDTTYFSRKDSSVKVMSRDMMDNVSRVGARLGCLHLDLSSGSGSRVGMECEPEPI